MRRRWLERGVLVVAAFASIATSKKKWYLDAEIPVGADTSGPRIVTIEASQQPEIAGRDLSGFVRLVPMDPKEPRWPGKAKYLVPAGVALSRLSIHGDSCKTSGATFGCGGGECEIPVDAHVRITATTPIATWKVEITGAPQTVSLKSSRTTWSYVTVRSSQPNVRMRVKSDGLEPSSVGESGPDKFAVYWPERTEATTVTWTPVLTMEGACPDATPCPPPADAILEITAFTEDGYDHTK